MRVFFGCYLIRFDCFKAVLDFGVQLNLEDGSTIGGNIVLKFLFCSVISALIVFSWVGEIKNKFMSIRT